MPHHFSLLFCFPPLLSSLFHRESYEEAFKNYLRDVSLGDKNDGSQSKKVGDTESSKYAHERSTDDIKLEVDA